MAAGPPPPPAWDSRTALFSRCPKVTAGPHPWDLPGHPAETAENRQGTKATCSSCTTDQGWTANPEGRSCTQSSNTDREEGVAGESSHPAAGHAHCTALPSSGLPTLGAASNSPLGPPLGDHILAGTLPKTEPGSPSPLRGPSPASHPNPVSADPKNEGHRGSRFLP